MNRDSSRGAVDKLALCDLRAPVLFLFMFVYSGIGIYLAQRSLNSTFSTLYFSEFHSVTESEG